MVIPASRPSHDVRQAAAVSVVHMQGELAEIDDGRQTPDRVQHLNRVGDANRVSQRDLGAAEREQPLGDPKNGVDLDVPLVGAAEDHRDVAANS